jgi:4-hydroxy-3-polyprenylbenzoate decarboxylase
MSRTDQLTTSPKVGIEWEKETKLNSNKANSSSPERAYHDLHDHVRALEEAQLLLKVDVPVNKDTEMHPLMRWQFCGGMEENDRKAMLFTNVVDSKGKKYDMPVLIGAMAASPKIFEIGVGRPLDKIVSAWAEAMDNLTPPRLVENGPCQEVIIEGDDLNTPGRALDALPVPISTPGWEWSISHDIWLHHQRPRNRYSKSRKLPGPDQSTPPCRHEHVGRA